ncbi:hypothetical protein LTH96_11055 [Nesterenkonia sp. LB17]|uniref:DUF3995 domain-containing protein n=2 Tax=unclassified Nesterenkonia TaxID=2629769 RepID=UPI001F4D353A|nr:DUF3995 domain-containing protein [Nesterenkonia sp. LB17]MCH8563600.1 hypothetical protein [Nesterenkonia sp. YGD6]MCH8566250.1 hypothetical protein [Nesterenkonia sp. LB17]
MMKKPTALIWCAGLLGLLNAAPSYYWAFGGDALLETIGQWLITLRTDMPVLTSLALLGIGLGKTLAVVIPLVAARLLTSSPLPSQRLTSRSRRPRPALWWNLSRLIGAGLILYGAAGLGINAGLLLWPGLDLQDPTARLGQALLWYPMLLVWGLVLAAGLRRLRASVAA